MKLKMMLTFFAIAAVCSGMTAIAAPATMEVLLTISPSRSLPGMSVPLHLRVKTGTSAVELAPGVRVRATSPTGESFLATWGSENIVSGPLEFGLIDEEDDHFIIPAKSTVELSVPAVSFMQSSWAHDGRLVSMPGRWKLEVILYDKKGKSDAVSSPATLDIERPPARDVWIWQALERGETLAIADKVFVEQPDSPYFPYISTAVRRYSALDKVAIISRAIELHPNSPVVPWLRYGIANYYDMESGRVFFEERDLEKAVTLAEKGRAELVRLKDGNDAWSRLKGNQKMGDYPSREGFAELQRLAREKGTRKP